MKKVYKKLQKVEDFRDEKDDCEEESGCSCGHCDDDDDDDDDDDGERFKIIRVAFGAALLAVALILPKDGWLRLIPFIAAYVLAGGDVFLRAAKNLLRGKVFDENFLMVVASLGAFAIGEFPEGCAVMLFYQVGELCQDFAVTRSRRSIRALMDIRPDRANLKVGSELKVVAPQDVEVGQLIVVKPGERVPLDGVVTDGTSALDTSALTGESLPRNVSAGDAVLSGSVNTSGLLTVEVSRAYAESTVAKILEMTQNAAAKKAPTESFITKFARVYTPAVVCVAVLLAVLPPLAFGADFTEWLHRALIFLVISCPCALVVSIPLGFFGGIGCASRNGILVKGGNYLEALCAATTFVFDKTGTLTRGVFSVTDVTPAAGFTRDELLSLAAQAESQSTHPIAVSVTRAFTGGVDLGAISDYEEIPGRGVAATVGGRRILAGSARLLTENGVAAQDVSAIGTAIHIACGGVYAGRIVVSDEPKVGAAQAIASLRGLGVTTIAMLTGDSRAVAESVAQSLGITDVHAELLPQDKVAQLEQLQGVSRGATVFVGDGINDAPVLAMADVGVAMGQLGSDAATEAADVVLMTDEPKKLAVAIKIARLTKRVVRQNIVFALGAKAVILVLGALGIANMWLAVFADVGVALIAIVNSSRIVGARFK
ncbi:MAG: cadmium-translocating P-type ATPase [Oscillospiraceae bacterium]|jgi:Cd2+/Zn2+-exporting ATPase|nr:cadmium-translocating P-type ATPase [Oscillospiraceae bacterium]